MNTAILIVGVLILTVTSLSGLAIALISSKTLSRAFQHAERIHERSIEHQAELLDRIMAVDYAQFTAWKSTQGDEQGEFLAPQDQEGVEVKSPGWGSASPVRIRLASMVEGDHMPGDDPEEGLEETQGVPKR